MLATATTITTPPYAGRPLATPFPLAPPPPASPPHPSFLCLSSILGCDGARRRDSPLPRHPRRGRPPSPHGCTDQSLAKRPRPQFAAALRPSAGACESCRATRPVAPATPHTAAMLAPPQGGQQAVDHDHRRTATSGERGLSFDRSVSFSCSPPLPLRPAHTLVHTTHPEIPHTIHIYLHTSFTHLQIFTHIYIFHLPTPRASEPGRAARTSPSLPPFLPPPSPSACIQDTCEAT